MIEIQAVTKRVSEEINQVYKKYDMIYDRLYTLTEKRFTPIREWKCEPWQNWLNPMAPMWYVFEYTFDGKKYEAVSIKIEQTLSNVYDKNPRPYAIIKQRGDQDYYLWPEGMSREQQLSRAARVRKDHIQVFLEDYNEFIGNKQEFLSQIKSYEKIFTPLQAISE